MFTNSTDLNETTTDEAFTILFKFLTVIDIMVRILSLLVHLTYFYLVYSYKELHKKGLVYLHHTNLVNLIYCCMFMFYIGNLSPSFQNETLNTILCTLSELAWSMLKYLQAYSIVLLSSYRVIACYNTVLFRKINRTYYIITFPIIFIWILSFTLYISTKFSFNTTYGSIYCIDGYSVHEQDEINYFISTEIFSFLIPFIIVFVLFISIYLKMTEHDEIDHSQKSSIIFHIPIILHRNSRSSVFHGHEEHNHFHHNKGQTHQLFYINICYALSFTINMLLDLRYILNLSSGYLLIVRMCFRIASFLAHLFMPLISMYYTPFLMKKLNKNVTKKVSNIEFPNTSRKVMAS